MRYIYIIFTALLTVFCFSQASAQGVSNFGANRAQDSSKTKGQIVAPVLATSDTNQVIGVTSTGQFVLRTKIISPGVDTSLFVKKSDSGILYVTPFDNSDNITWNDTNTVIGTIWGQEEVRNGSIQYMDTVAMVATKHNLDTLTGTVYEVKNKVDTLASGIYPALNNRVPYTGATGNVTLGKNDLQAQRIVVTDSADNGGTRTGILGQRLLSNELDFNGHFLKDITRFNRGNYKAYASLDVNFTDTADKQDHLAGLQVRWAATISDTLRDGWGSIIMNTFNGTGKLLRNYGYDVADIAGTGQVIDNYGIRIRALSRGTNNFAIYAEGTTPSYHGGRFNVLGNICANCIPTFTSSYAGYFNGPTRVNSSLEITGNFTATNNGISYSYANQNLGIGIGGAPAATYSIEAAAFIRSRQSLMAGSSGSNDNLLVGNGPGGDFVTVQRVGANVAALGYTASITTLGTPTLYWTQAGRIGMGNGISSPGAYVHFRAGDASLAPIRINAGTVRTSPGVGDVGFDGTSLLFSVSSTFLRVPLTNNAIPTNGQIPIGNGTNYTVANITAGTGISVVNGAGSITLRTDTATIASNLWYIENTAITATTSRTLTRAFNQFYVDATSGNVTLTFTPSYAGQTIHVTRNDNTGNVVTIQFSGGIQVNGSSTYTGLSGINSNVQLFYNGSNVRIQ